MRHFKQARCPSLYVSPSIVNVRIDKGISPKRVSAVSYGDTTPIALNNSKEGKAQNLRIEIALVHDLSQLPGFDELQPI
jgi:hypothetical protein